MSTLCARSCDELTPLFRQLKKLIEFGEHEHIRNPSRIVPSTLASKTVTGGNTILIAAGSRDTVIQFATVVFLTQTSKIYSMEESLGEDRRTLRGIPNIVEWERMQAGLCMAHRVPSANVNMRAGAVVFCTGKTMKYCELHAANICPS